jgi:adenylosuccinate synthase
MGPFPTELLDETGDNLRKAGNEYGSTTGRPRRCGWLDLVALKYSVMLNGATELIMMKADVLDNFDSIKICVAYEIEGQETENFPFELNDDVNLYMLNSRDGKPTLQKSKVRMNFREN